MYSDKPQAGARPVTLPELNVSANRCRSPKRLSRRRERRRRKAAIRGGSACLPASSASSSPQNDGSVAANTAHCSRCGSRWNRRCNWARGMPSWSASTVGPSASASPRHEFMIPPEFWGDTLPPANQHYQLDAAIVDGNGAVLKRAEPVTFYLRHVAGWHQRPHQRPLLRPLPVQKPPPAQPSWKFEQPGKPSSSVKPPVRPEP
jgi:hypothetical protein